MTRSFRVYATKADLRNLLGQFQKEMDVYFCPDYAKEMLEIDDITPYFEVEPTQLLQYDKFLVFPKGVTCTWKPGGATKYTCVCNENTERVSIDCHRLRGMEIGNLLPVEFSTVHYELESVKKMYNKLHSVFQRNSKERLYCCLVCPDAYETKENWNIHW